ncbi:MAG: hypothetical protein IT423_07310 [Pirellulaceae bacterium]|nr:hypothetical protein [Pirellulaceae bacterium]
MSEQPSGARARYESRLSDIAQQQARLEKRNGVFVMVRTALFFGAAILLSAGYLGAEPRGLLLVIGWSLAAAFLVAITAHEHIRLTDMSATRKKKLYERLLARMDRRWAALTVIPSGVAEQSALADDLDLFGPTSLWQLLALPSTGFGRRTLGSWLLQVPTADQLKERQQAVKQLQPAYAQREEILDTIATISDDSNDATALATWAAEPAWLPAHRLAHALSWIAPALIALGMTILVFANFAAEPSNTILWIAVSMIGAGFGINLILTMGWGSWMHEIFLRVTGSNRDAQQLSHAFAAIGKLPGDSLILEQIRQSASQGELSAVAGFRSLMWRVVMANLQRDPLFYIVYLALQLVVAWDFRVMESLERWKKKFGPAAHGWFEALGRCEALIASATLADENPSWVFPSPCDDPQLIFKVETMGHPLLPNQQRVNNNLQLDRQRPLLLVTGSNMAGKSTLLRSLGLNQILARTGGPVCAGLFQSPLFELATSICVRDSLKEGVSFFMAELKRLKEVVDIAQHANENKASHAPVMFLLDEILQGTNSRERQIAVMKVIQRLLERDAIGAISTHDLELADQSVIQSYSQIVHFREYFETIDGVQKMRFDYIMRPGPTPTTNALKLLKMVGLDDT